MLHHLFHFHFFINLILLTLHESSPSVANSLSMLFHNNNLSLFVFVSLLLLLVIFMLVVPELPSSTTCLLGQSLTHPQFLFAFSIVKILFLIMGFDCFGFLHVFLEFYVKKSIFNSGFSIFDSGFGFFFFLMFCLYML